MKKLSKVATKSIKLYWFNKKGVYGNYGDELGPYIIKGLSKNNIYQIKINRTGIKLILAYLKGLILRNYSIRILPNVLKTLILNGDYVISIGSIIGWGNGKRIVWGSGILFKDEKISKGTFLAVRGKYTSERLKALGYKSPTVFGDPALLLPLVKPLKYRKTYKIGLIPHHTQFDHFKEYEKTHNIKVINLIGNVEEITKQIISCEKIISSSLHGIIVPHAYGIPALWYEYQKIKWKGENIKFLDYFSSVGIPEYNPLILKEINEFDLIEIDKNFINYSDYLLPKYNITDLQLNLLNVAPFEVADEIKQSLIKERNS